LSDSKYDHVFDGFVGERGDLIPILQRVNEAFGYISEDATKHISQFLKISENEIIGVASFYSQFRFVEPGRNSIKICLGTACHVWGGETLSDAVQREYHIGPGETTEDKRFDLQRVACLGCCALAPVVQVNEDIHSRVTANSLLKILEQYE
jgi:NADH-quinone oxidoreductase subunit E